MNQRAAMEVLHGGMLALLQDAGRRSVMESGLATGGAADGHAYAWVNRLLANSADASVIEVTLGGLQVRFAAATTIALTGADCQPRLNDDVIPMWQTVVVPAGAELHLGHVRKGLRSYLAVAGGFHVERSLGGSCSTVLREEMGGLDNTGRRLEAGDCLHYEPMVRPHQAVSSRFIPDYQQPLTLRVVLGAQVDSFSNASLNTFFSSSYMLSPKSDRMGIRLEGASIASLRTGLISEGIALGAIQVPADGQPIILMQDRQTIGGYPKLGSVLPLDLYALAQRQPGAELKFSPISLFEAQQTMVTFLKFFR